MTMRDPNSAPQYSGRLFQVDALLEAQEDIPNLETRTRRLALSAASTESSENWVFAKRVSQYSGNL
jgi:hypothetical protein